MYTMLYSIYLKIKEWGNISFSFMAAAMQLIAVILKLLEGNFNWNDILLFTVLVLLLLYFVRKRKNSIRMLFSGEAVKNSISEKEER